MMLNRRFFLSVAAMFVMQGSVSAENADEKDIVTKAVQAAKVEAMRIVVAAQLEKALRVSESAGFPEEQIATLKVAASEARRKMTANVLVEEILGRVEQSKSNAAASLKEWRAAVTEARDILRFEPLVEAPLPEGFPTPTPVGEIRVQHYPKYRLARTDMTFIEGRAFLTLFNHIQRSEIAMTAPVELTYAVTGDAVLKKSGMSFLYRSTEQGELGVQGKVQVVDIPSQIALSIGIRGAATTERIADAKRRLENWLKTHAKEYEQTAALRVMGYNSPFVSNSKRFTEVQIPVTAKRRK